MNHSNSNQMQTKQKNRRRLFFSVLFVNILILSVLIYQYINDYYPANQKAQQALISSESVKVEELEDVLIFTPKEIRAGIIFYPGGKVEYRAYAPLMQALAENGFLCILPHMPANLAVLAPNAADGFLEQYPDVPAWYIGGHSLGGAMAASYVSNHTGDFNGLLLLAAYSTVDLSQSGLSVLSVYGSNDRVLNMEKYEESKENLPASAKECIIDGGCHAYFGCYGEQDGDGEATITNAEQIQTTVDYVTSYFLSYKFHNVQ